MEESLFVNNHIVNLKEGKLSDELQLTINLFDKKGNEVQFSSSFMQEDIFLTYEQSVLKALNSKSWLQVVHNEPLHILKPVLDNSSKNIVGLETKHGLILKNMVKFY